MTSEMSEKRLQQGSKLAQLYRSKPICAGDEVLALFIDEAIAEIRHLRSAPAQPDLWAVLAEMAVWADATFPREGVAQKLEHLSEELAELRADPCDLEEWADCFSLLFDAARKHKLSPTQITLAIQDKFEKNKLRKWDDGGINGVYHHLKEAPAQPSPTPFTQTNQKETNETSHS